MLHNSSRSRVTNVVVIDNIPMISETLQCPLVSPITLCSRQLTQSCCCRLSTLHDSADLRQRLALKIACRRSKTATWSQDTSTHAQKLEGKEHVWDKKTKKLLWQ